ncbi:AAA family ATPase [Nocardia thailandica]|uniref:AAA family ATPase n=1 Tax=Nocardia thailandica TaxID=257275 RepID=A0ABW6PXC0_9NOCA
MDLTLVPGGVFHGGTAFLNYRRAQLTYLIDVASHLRTVQGGELSLDRTDPLAFRTEIDHVQTRQVVQRNALLYMAFPQFFLPIVNAEHRTAIRDAFADYLQHLPGDVDADLAEINQAIVAEEGGQVDFYQSPWKQRWQEPADAAQPTDAVQHAWWVRGSDVLGMDVVPMWAEQGIVSLSAKLLRPVDPETITRDELKLYVEQDYRTSGYGARQEKVDEFYSFLNRMHVGDLVVTVSRQVLYVGTITGDAESVSSDDGRSNLRRTVKWESHGIPIDKVASSLTPLINSPSDVTDLSAEIDTVRQLMGHRPLAPQTREANLPDATAELADRLHVPYTWLQECVELLRDRPQLIFYGPPGTGKTYLAQALAEHIATDGNVKVVQFHLVRPKITDLNRLIFLLGYALRPDRVWRDDPIRLDSADELLPALAEAFSRITLRAAEQGLPMGYRTVEDSLPVVRGRIMAGVQMRDRQGLPLPLAVEYDELTTDIDENRILLLALTRLLTMSRVTDAARRRLHRLRLAFGEVTLLDKGAQLPTWKATRLNTRFHNALRLAEVVLAAESFEHRFGTITVTGYLFDMARIFEDFVCVALREALAPLGGRVAFQHRLALDVAGDVITKPDLVWFAPGRAIRAIADAKYKAEKPAGFPDADLYQMLAYCTASNLPDGHLIYARGDQPVRSHRIMHSPITIHCHTLDLSLSPAALLAEIDRLAARLATTSQKDT